MKKMLAILGSPRKNGNASKMLDYAIGMATSKGYDIDYVNVYEKDIAYCRGCMKCKTLGKCINSDDLDDIRNKLIQSDLVVICSPTYFANITAPLKNMFDRLVATVMDDNASTIPKKKLSKNQEYILMTTCNTPSPFDKIAKQSTGCLRAMNEVMHISGMTHRGNVVFAGTRNKTEIPSKVLNKIKRLIY